ncbi:hypothetical protein [Colwellia sp. 20A7]|uniref:hypothetical protein n=1 Tax=Colwellia sp. 20A7 TaxID=2689569 RepID=UPI00135984DA|nr:hypothetical protein [Colwellia sp. 20A7]
MVEQNIKTPCDLNQLVLCPRCHCEIKEKNLKKHISRVHINKSKKSKAIAKDIAERKELRTDNSFYSDKDIAMYLAENPVVSQTGIFGVPQDKYRWGSFGVSSMEYDSWSKNDK